MGESDKAALRMLTDRKLPRVHALGLRLLDDRGQVDDMSDRRRPANLDGRSPPSRNRAAAQPLS